MSWIEEPGAEMFNGLNLTDLNIDQAYLRMNSSLPDSWLYTLSKDCHNCPYTRLAKFESPDKVIKLEVIQQEFWRVLSKDVGKHLYQEKTSDVLCDVTPELGEFGVYRLEARKDFCDFSVEKEAVNIYLPFLILFFIILGIIAIWKFISPIVMRKYFANQSSQENGDIKKVTVKKRVRSLDTFRGLSIVLMIFVNDGAGKYWWLEHATWNGLTVGDLLFPCFLWIMGVCIPMSVKSIITQNLCKKTALWNIFRRSCTLFLLGLALGSLWGPYLDDLRIFGVLQRFGICYWIVASLAVIAGKKREQPEGKWGKMFQDITELGVQWVIMMFIILLHLLILFLVPAPGCPTGYMGAGGKQDNHAHEDCIGGITKHIDIVILGDSHLYQNPTAKFVYESGSFDPEGIFGCLLSIVHVFFGVQAGTTLQHFKKWKPLLSRWLLWAAVTGLIGGILCNFSKEDGAIPVNKNLWSLSFVLVTTCFAFIVLSVFYLLIDVLHWWSGAPFLQPGMNSITMYVGHTICYNMFPFHWRVPNMRTHFVLLMEAAWGTVLWILVAFEMARKKVFVTV